MAVKTKTKTKEKAAATPKRPKAIGLVTPKVGQTKNAEISPRLRIRVMAYESKILDSSVKQIIDTALRYDAKIVGPVPLPTEIKNTQSTERPSSTKMRENNLR